MKTTLLTNIYNEEYLLPFWLHHHKDMFDDIIIVNYYSTDKSIEICKSICPDCKIIQTRNPTFGAEEADKELMDIENGIEGIKIVLTTTEFLLCETSVRDIFINTDQVSYGINTASPYSLNTYNVNNYCELFSNLLNNDIVWHHDLGRGHRQIHTFSNGNYSVGRHHTWNNYTMTNKAHIIWFGYYPMNEKLLQRKLKVSTHIPDTDRSKGYSWQHFLNKEQLLNMNTENVKTGRSLKDVSLSAYNLLSQKYTKMNIMKTTLLTNIYNEEYLLPFWLHHHKDMFDDIIIVNYYSTDKSIEICKSICPNCKIIQTRNPNFDAEEVDKELMDIENGIDGIKMILNTTEFLFCETSVRDIFINNTSPMSYGIYSLTPYSNTIYNINTYSELICNLSNKDVVYHHDRWARQIHNFSNGNYSIGRHNTFNNNICIDRAYIIWFGYYPMNDKLLQRKLNVCTHIPDNDPNKGLGTQHFYSKEQILNINTEKSNSGSSLEYIYIPAYLYNFLTLKKTNI